MRAAHGSVGSSCRLGLGDHSAEAKLQDFVKEERHGALLQRVIAYDLVSGRVPLLRASFLCRGEVSCVQQYFGLPPSARQNMVRVTCMPAFAEKREAVSALLWSVAFVYVARTNQSTHIA